MKILRLSFRSQLKMALVGCAVILAAVSSVVAAPSEKEIPFKETKYRGIKVRHVATPADEKARPIAAPGTPRTKLPVLDAPGPKGGKMVRTDNTFLVHDSAPALQPQPVNATPVLETKNSATDSHK